jgi:hypothetical protein
MKQGDAFLGGGEIHGQHHLWLIINDPAAHEGIALVVNVSTLRRDADSTCIVTPGEHPFIKHDSYVRFARARRARIADLAEALKKGLLKPHQPASRILLEKIRRGARASPQLPSDLRALL